MSRAARIVLIILLVLVTVPLVAEQPVYAATISLSPSKDNYIDSYYSTTNYGSNALMRVGYPYAMPEIERGLIQFDVAWGTTIPSGATITSATLYMNYAGHGPSDPVGRTIEVQRLLRLDWSETASTWTNYKTGSAWTTAGAGSSTSDYTTSGQAGATVPAGYGWMSWNVLTIVQWTQANNANIAFRVIDSSETYDYDTAFRTKEDSTPSVRPYLVIAYIVPPTVTVSAATSVTNTTARLNGNVVDTGGANPTVTVYWGDNDGGTTPANWDNNSVPTSPSQPQGVAAFYKDVTGLAEDTLIYFKARAVNSAGTSWSSTLSFTTYGDPDVDTQAASAIAATTARLNSIINNQNGLPVTIRFGWGLTSKSAINDYDHYETVAGTWTTGQHPYLDISSLVGSTLYYFRVEGTTAYGTDLGVELNFTTQSSVGDPSDFHGIPTGTTVSLTWTKGAGAGESVIRFAAGSYPTSPTEGFAVYSGTSSSYLHTGLTGGTTLYYSVWGMSGGNYSTNYATLMITTSADVTGGGVFTPPSEPSRWVSAPDYTNLQNVPIAYDTINAIADSWGMPRETAWFLFALFTSFGLAILFYTIAGHKFVIAEFTLEICLVAWWIVQIMPFWIPLIAGIIIVGYAIGHQEVKTY